ncbi:MAG: ribonuclease H family protein [Anaerovoracaceae bacterium]
MTVLKIYTDGACSGNQNEKNIGGWGAILEFGQHQKELHGGEINTTNNRMEMKGLLSAFQAITRDGQTIEVYCDSSYLMDCFRKKWYRRWLRNGWQTSQKKPVENRDLWEQLLPFLDKHDISFYRVKGHVNLEHPSTNGKAIYKKFVAWNGSRFSYDEFAYITDMNNRADALANLGMDELR